MEPHLRELADQLSLILLGHTYVGSSTAPETFLIDFLVEYFHGWTMGDYELEELQETFEAHVPTFDLPLFIAKLRERGVLRKVVT